MRCSGSPTICTAAEVAPREGAPGEGARVAERGIEGILFANALRPLAEVLGPYGESALAFVAREISGDPASRSSARG